MLSRSFYEPSELPTVSHASPKQHIIDRISRASSERTLLVSVLHMLLGLPSDAFLFDSHFSVDPQLPDLHHLGHQLLLQELERLTALGNGLLQLRTAVKTLSKSRHRVLEGFGAGVSLVLAELEEKVHQKLKSLRQEEGTLRRDEQQLQGSRAQPSSIAELGIALSGLEGQVTKLAQVLSELPLSGSPSR
jgi:hypothetical protein